MLMQSTWTPVQWRFVASSIVLCCLLTAPVEAQQSCQPFAFEASIPTPEKPSAERVELSLSMRLIAAPNRNLVTATFCGSATGLAGLAPLSLVDGLYFHSC